MDANATITGDVDKTQIPPLNQKRILAFVNHFLISTCTYLNEFALGCETKFVEMERQLQKTEASLIILEAKLASIPTDNETDVDTGSPANPLPVTTEIDAGPTPVAEEPPEHEPETEQEPQPVGVRACEDVRYRKFFKMLHVGVPTPAVKQKMNSEGLDSQLLDTPDRMLEDGVRE
ncbi:WASH complex subunit 3 [Drosophila guanche]|uniref:Blast:WASH complex subunit CCDC53 homolog n=1 Tax=Drosophila guanche TaxID=7266 RepID=A0A3B0JBT1_DROGU|nr:WASH complex subunit 3 [Drosophila guanche]SPP79817.1 blast:WASH complex subunit CCDC53 homolog [Drosophila guanche]